MFSHVTIGSDDPVRAASFYDVVLAPLGITRAGPPAAAGAEWRREGQTGSLWIGKPFDGGKADRGNGWMAAFTAPSRAAVDAAHAAALANGGSCEGPPGLRPQYASDYYGAYVRDPEGNKLHFVRRGET